MRERGWIENQSIPFIFLIIDSLEIKKKEFFEPFKEHISYSS